MNKIVPFKKEIKLEDDFKEIVSIELEHNYKKENNKIIGDFIITGSYKNDEISKPFNYNLPFQVNLDKKYDLDDIDVLIDDFYYEIKDNNLIISIDLSIENLNERCIDEDLFKEEDNKVDLEVKEEKEVKEENKEEKNEYTTYKVYIVKENDTIESICNLYNISKEELEKYNDLNEFKTKDKIIIPYIFNETNK